MWMPPLLLFVEGGQKRVGVAILVKAGGGAI